MSNPKPPTVTLPTPKPPTVPTPKPPTVPDTEEKYTLEEKNNSFGEALCNVGVWLGVGSCACLIAPDNKQYFKGAITTLGVAGTALYITGTAYKLNVTDKDKTNDLVPPMAGDDDKEEPVTKNTKKTNKKRNLLIKGALISTVACIPLLKKKLRKNK
jgi:hypothetical protein